MSKLPPSPSSTANNSLARLLRLYLRASTVCVGLLLLAFLLLWVFSEPQVFDRRLDLLSGFLDGYFFLYMLVGFVAQMIDGALGMAYGISSTSFLVSMGVSPAFASSSVHLAEVFTTAVSGFSHWKMGNVSKKLFLELAIPGVLGALAGSFFLSYYDGSRMKIFISIYLLIMGSVIIFKSLQKRLTFKKVRRVFPLALFGGVLDASGGGGWGPVVTTTFLGSGAKPRLTIGTVNAVEFFIALSSSGVFTMMLGISNYKIILGLMLGGVVAAPIGAFICQRINVKIGMIVVGVLIMLISLVNIVKFFL